MVLWLTQNFLCDSPLSMTVIFWLVIDIWFNSGALFSSPKKKEVDELLFVFFKGFVFEFLEEHWTFNIMEQWELGHYQVRSMWKPCFDFLQAAILTGLSSTADSGEGNARLADKPRVQFRLQSPPNQNATKASACCPLQQFIGQRNGKPYSTSSQEYSQSSCTSWFLGWFKQGWVTLCNE